MSKVNKMPPREWLLGYLVGWRFAMNARSYGDWTKATKQTLYNIYQTIQNNKIKKSKKK